MSAEVKFTNGVSIADGGNVVLNGLLGDLFDQDNISAEKNDDLMAKLGMTYTKPLNLEETFDIMIGWTELDEIAEGADLPEIDVAKGKWKGFAIKQFGWAYKVTKLFMEWAKKSETLENADSSVQKEWARLARNIKGLDRSKIRTKNKLFAEIFTKGKYSDQANGAWSVTAYGQPLFSVAHPYREWTATFSNVSELALDATNLLAVIKQLNVDVRLQNGDYIEEPTEYTLLVPRALRTVARQVLNNGSKFSWQDANSAELNVFTFEGSRVKLEVVDKWGTLDKDGDIIWALDMWVVLNKEGALEAQALRFLELYPASIESYKNDYNKNEYISIDLGCAVDHYGLEQFCIWSKIPAVVV